MNSQKQTRDHSKYTSTQDGETSYGVCHEKMYRKNLPTHFDRNYDGKAPLEKIQMEYRPYEIFGYFN